MALNQQLWRPLLIRHSYCFEALALALGGRSEEATEAIETLDALDIPALIYQDVDIIQARAWVDVAAGHIALARSDLEEAVQLADELGDLVGEASALHGLARLGQAAGVRDRLLEVTSQIEGSLAPARAAHTVALASGDAAALAQVSRDFEAMGADLLAAEAAADAAVARRRAGELRQAAALERRAARLVDRCEGPITPALQAIEARARLTPAERETALLAARGYSNKQIASELLVSVRTVENRLQRVYEKLGVSGRTELSDALG